MAKSAWHVPVGTKGQCRVFRHECSGWYMLDENAQTRRIAIRRAERIAEATAIALDAQQRGAIDGYAVEEASAARVFTVTSRRWGPQADAVAQRITAIVA